jgi:hypothetical protein
MADFERIRADHSARRLLADNRCQFVFGCEGSDHLAGTGGMLIYQNHDSAVKRLASQPLRLDRDGFVAKAEFEYQRKEAELRKRDSVEHR